MNEHEPSRDELGERLIDRSLREVVGGEAPPDLKDAILAAASQTDSITLAEGETKMKTSIGAESRWSQVWWFSFAVAATLLVSVGLLSTSDRQTPRVAQSTAADGQDASADFDSLIDVIASTVDEETWENETVEDFKPDLSIVVDQSQSVDDSNEAAEEVNVDAFAASQSGVELQGLVAAKPAAAKPGQAVAVDASRRQRGGDRQLRDSMSLVTPGIIIEEEEEERLGFDKRPAGGTPLAADLPQFESTRIGSTVAVTDGGTVLLGGEKRLAELHREYNRKVESFGGEASGPGEIEVTILSNNLHDLEDRIAANEIELGDLELNTRVAIQQARSPSVVEAAIAQALDADPTIKNYQHELLAADRRIHELSSVGKNPNSRELKRLYDMKQKSAQQLQQYSREAEKDIRTAFASKPNEVLQRTVLQYTLQKQALEEANDELRAEMRAKGERLLQKGARDPDLMAMMIRIEQAEAKLREAKVNEGRGPGNSGDQYERIVENPFVRTADENLSTFSIDVDTASYANVRQFLLGSGQLPPPDAVRIEELVNYFDYDYSPPTDDTPFSSAVEIASCPWNANHRLVRVGIKGREIDTTNRPQSNLVFLIDVSGSMNEPAKLPRLVEGMRMLTRELGENDRVAIVVYASSEGLALESTPGTEQATILAALDQLRAGGSTAGGAGIELAYKTAQENFIEGGVNRVILCTDGDFNVGVTSPAELERMAEEKAKDTGVFLTVLGFGRGNLNDAMMERISGKGNGNYYYVDGRTEARKVLVAEMAGTLVTIAKDVKLQIDFNPAKTAGYRLLGYENRMLEKQDFNDDAKDAGEIGAGHTVTALYEIVPAGAPVESAGVDESKYVRPSNLTDLAAESDELFTLKIRYKQPDGDKSTKLEFPATDGGQKFAEASDDFKFAASVAGFGMLLRGSEYAGNATLGGVLEIAESAAKARDPHGYRAEFVEMVRRAEKLQGE